MNPCILYFMYLPHRNTQAWNLSGEKQRDTWSKEQTWTTPLRYIFMSIWFFCHLGLDEGSTDLRTNRKTKKWVNRFSFPSSQLHRDNRWEMRRVWILWILYFFWSLSGFRLSILCRAPWISLMQNRTKALNTADRKRTSCMLKCCIFHK